MFCTVIFSCTLPSLSNDGAIYKQILHEEKYQNGDSYLENEKIDLFDESNNKNKNSDYLDNDLNTISEKLMEEIISKRDNSHWQKYKAGGFSIDVFPPAPFSESTELKSCGLYEFSKVWKFIINGLVGIGGKIGSYPIDSKQVSSLQSIYEIWETKFKETDYFFLPFSTL